MVKTCVCPPRIHKMRLAGRPLLLPTPPWLSCWGCSGLLVLKPRLDWDSFAILLFPGLVLDVAASVASLLLFWDASLSILSMNFGVKKNSRALLQRLPFELKFIQSWALSKTVPPVPVLCLVMWWQAGVHCYSKVAKLSVAMVFFSPSFKHKTRLWNW